MTPTPDFETEPQKYYDSINNDKTSIACYFATKLVMACGAGAGNKLLERDVTDRNDFVPGDWGYIYNDAHQWHVNQDRSDIPWEHGLEGENIIFAGSLGFWGHFGPGNTYYPLGKWMQEVGSWKSKNGDPSRPRLSTRVQFPSVGIDHVEEH